MFILNTPTVGASILGRDLPANLTYLTRGVQFPSTLPFQNNLPQGLNHLVQSSPSYSSSLSLLSRFTSLVGKAPAGQQFLVWGGIAGLGLNMFFDSESSTLGKIFNFGLSIAGLATLFPPLHVLILPLAAIYAARGLWTLATGEGFLGKSMGLLDLACAIPVFGMVKNWANISKTATDLAGRTGINTAHAYLRTIAKYSFGPTAGKQISWIAGSSRSLSSNPREAFGNLAETTGRGLSRYWGRFRDGLRNAPVSTPPFPTFAGAGAGV